MKLVLLFFLLSVSAYSADIKLKDYNWNMTDVSSRGLTKEVLYSRMDREFIKKGSICSNRAHIWANNFKRDFNLDTGKIFLFFTKKEETRVRLKTWWYHVSPVVNENGNIWVMDAGFRGFIKTPLNVEEWLQKFANTSRCKDINASETELVEHIFKERTFPQTTPYGSYECYYKIVPHTIWTPDVLAQNLLGKDASGRPVRVERDEINKEELYQACLEATSSKIGYALGSSKEKCKEYVGL